MKAKKPLEETQEKRLRVIVMVTLIFASVLGVYLRAYGVLRFTKYFVRQEFTSFHCRESILRQLDAEFPTAKQITVESNRNQIGCGRIQKDDPRFAETIMLHIFSSLAEMEMRLRGYNTGTLYVRDNYVDEEVSGPHFTHTPLLKKIKITRSQQD